MENEFITDRLLRLTVRTMDPATRSIIKSRSYDFDEDHYEMSDEDEDEIRKVEEYLRRETICFRRTIPQWEEIIQQFCPQHLQRWVASIIWWDYISSLFTMLDAREFEDKYLHGFKPPFGNWEKELVACLDAMDHPFPKRRIHNKPWDTFYDNIKERLSVRLAISEKQKISS